MERDEILRNIQIIVEVYEESANKLDAENKARTQPSDLWQGRINGERSVIRHLKEILETA